MANKQEPWLQREDESAPAYSAFKHYRDAGDGRSFVKTAQDLGKARQVIERWAFAYQWSTRVRAHTTDLEKEARRDRRKKYNDMYERHTVVASLLIKKAVERLKDEDPASLSVMEAMRFIKLGVDIEREARAFNLHAVAQSPEDVAQSVSDAVHAANKKV